ncbi:MAG: DUF427 domain-containing protein [Acidiferrobacterales bacterium]
MKAIWKGTTIAESDDTVVVEGNHYFPASAVNMEYMDPSETKSNCPWKGIASYYTINVDGELNADAAWYYPEPKDAAKNIQGHIAFWRDVEITE